MSFQRLAFQLNFQQLEEEEREGVVLLPSGRHFRKKDLALYALACYARSYAGAGYTPLRAYNPAAFKRERNPLLSVFA